MTKEIIKEIGRFSFKVKTKISDCGEFVLMGLSFNDDLLNFVKQSISIDKGFIKESFDFSDEEIQRHKVKTAVFNNLNYRYKGLLFNKDLIKKGFVDLKVLNIQYIDSITDCLKRNFKDLIRFYYNLNEETTINFKLEENI